MGRLLVLTAVVAVFAVLAVFTGPAFGGTCSHGNLDCAGGSGSAGGGGGGSFVFNPAAGSTQGGQGAQGGGCGGRFVFVQDTSVGSCY
jgi:hypothetical protein